MLLRKRTLTSKPRTYNHKICLNPSASYLMMACSSSSTMAMLKANSHNISNHLQSDARALLHNNSHDNPPSCLDIAERKLEFAYAAEEKSGHRKFLSESFEERILNPACNEHSLKMEESRKSAWQYKNDGRILTEDNDRDTVVLARNDVIVCRPLATQETVFAFLDTAVVRDDLPSDPYTFASFKVAREAARALEAYQRDDEQVDVNDKVIEHHRYDYHNLHEHQELNDAIITRTLSRLLALRAPEPEYFEWACENLPDSIDYGSGRQDSEARFPRAGLECWDIVKVWQDIYSDDSLIAAELHDAGMLPYENSFGDNPHYIQAKLLWWNCIKGINGIEAIVRYYWSRARGLRQPNGYFLTDYQERLLNILPADACVLDIPEELRVFASLHAEPVDWDGKETFGVRAWCDEITADLVPPNLFDEHRIDINELIEESFGSSVEYSRDFGCRIAYEALLKYQDSIEPFAEAHCIIKDWARPAYLGRHGNSGGVSSGLTARVSLPPPDTTATASQHWVNLSPPMRVLSRPPGLQVSSAQKLWNQAIFADPAAFTPVPPPGLSFINLEQNKAKLAAILSQESIRAPPPGLNILQAQSSQYLNCSGYASRSRLVFALDAVMDEFEASLKCAATLPPGLAALLAQFK